MEVLFFIILLVSLLGNILCLFIFWDLLKVSSPKQLYNEKKKGLIPFITPMKDSDQFDLSEVDDEVLKQAVKDTITKVPEVTGDDEEAEAKAKELMI
jgi:hypothetical protein